MDKDIVVDRGLEGSDVGRWIVGDVTIEWDKVEEVLVYEFFLGVPKLLVILVNDCVLVWVAVVGGGTGRGGKELREESSSNSVRWRFNGKRWKRSRWLWSGGTGRRYSVDRGKNLGFG